MGIETLAVVSLLTTAYSIYQSGESGRDAQRARSRAEEQNKQVRAEQTAMNAADAAAERRRQVREERIRRARILQSSVTSGGGLGSSAEAGALDTLSTTLNANIGTNIGKIAAGERISEFSQQAATFMGQAESKAFDAQQWASYAQLGGNIFKAAGGPEQVVKATKSIFNPTT